MELEMDVVVGEVRSKNLICQWKSTSLTRYSVLC